MNFKLIHWIISIILITIVILLISLFFRENIKHSIKNVAKNIIVSEIDIKNFHINTISENFKNFIINTKKNTKNSESIKFISSDIIKSKNYKLNLIKYSYPEFSYYDLVDKPVAYLEFFDEKIFIISGMGNINYFDINESENNEIKLNKIKTNFQNFINDPLFFISSSSSIKDIHIDNEYMYISYTKLKSNDCYSMSILRSKININEMKFEDFYNNNECINNDSYANLLLTGGRIISYNDHLLFSIGEFQHRNLAQDLDNNFGKIIKINKYNKNSEILSYGHRNVQGLKFIKEQNIIISTEHGPLGGDEININKLKNNKLKNYGWPNSSYGEHYAEIIPCESKKFTINNLKLYKIISIRKNNECESSKLEKSHKKYNYIEPIKYYVPSIGISEIIEMKNHKKNQFILTSLRASTLFFLEFDDNYNELLSEELIEIGERIRDIIYVSTLNKYIVILEDTPSVAFIKIFENYFFYFR